MRVGTMALLVWLAAAGMAAAQDKPQFGFKVGPTFASIDFGDDGDYGSRIGVGGGGFVVLRPGERLALQLEALYRPSGSKLAELEGVDVTFKYLLNYFELPVLGRVNVTRSPSRAFYVFGGVAPAIRLSAKFETSASGTGFTQGSLDDISDDIELFEFSAVAGAGMDIGPHIVVDGRYTWGLTKLNDTADESLKNRTLTFLVGYRF